MGNPSHLRATERHLPLGLTHWHTVLPATRHRWTHPAITPAKQAGTRLTYVGGMEGWVDLGFDYMPRWFTCLLTVTHPDTKNLIAWKFQGTKFHLRSSYKTFVPENESSWVWKFQLTYHLGLGLLLGTARERVCGGRLTAVYLSSSSSQLRDGCRL